MANVLVVDREATTRSLVAEVLSDFGHRVRASEHASRSAQLARSEHFDVLLLDEDTCALSTFHASVQEPSSESFRAAIVWLRPRREAPVEPRLESTNWSILNKPVFIGELLRSLRPALNCAPISSCTDSCTASPHVDIAALSKLPLREAREQFEQAYLLHHMLAVGGRITNLADRIGVDRTHLYRKLRQLGLL